MSKKKQADPQLLSTWESLALDAVARVIEFWGFKKNQGRIWTLLYLRGKPMTAAELQSTLQLSKGAVSMVSRELERWGAIYRLRPPGSGSWQFMAETSLMKMVTNVFKEREASLISKVRADLGRAEQAARSADDTPAGVVDRLSRLRRLAQMAERALTTFTATAKLNFGSFFNVLRPDKEDDRSATGE